MKLKYIFIACSCLGLFSSCSDFLEENPHTQLSKENIFDSEQSAQSVLTGCYSDFASFSYNYYHMHTVTSGLGVSLKTVDRALSSMSILTNDQTLSKLYSGEYKVISGANDLIAGLANNNVINEVAKDNMIGEAKFLRALCYFNLVRQFGDVPMVTEVVEKDSVDYPREPVAKIYDEIIIKDLNDAFAKMPEPGQQKEGRPHKYAAKALLAKVYVTLAGNDPNSTYWGDAYNAAKEVYDKGGYVLVKPFSELWGAENKNTTEAILEIQFSATIKTNDITTATIVKGWDGMKNVISDSMWGKVRPTKYAFDMFASNDPRRDVTFIHTNYTSIFEKNAASSNITLYPSYEGTVGKWKNPDSDYAAWKKFYDLGYKSTSSCNFIFYRYADLLLLLAEAANELSEHQSEAYGYYKEVRDRSGCLVIADPGNLADLRDLIMKERLYELSGEAEEWFTLRRRGLEYPLFKDVLEAHNKAIDKQYPKNNWTVKQYIYKYDTSDEALKRNLLFPIPMDEIDRNGEIDLEDQNYGY